MRDHMMGWFGAVQQVNAWHPEVRKEVRTQVVRAPVDQAARLKQDIDPAKLPKGPEEGKVYWTERMSTKGRVGSFSKFSNGLWRSECERAIDALKQSLIKSKWQEREIIREATPEELGIKPVEKKSASVIIAIDKVYLVESPEGQRFSRYLGDGYWSVVCNTQLAAERTSSRTRYGLADIKPIRLAVPGDKAE